MKHQFRTSALSLALVVLAVGMSSIASAVNLSTVVAPIYQSGTGAGVYIGHTALASTNYNRLYAGGTYSVTCGAPGMVPLTGQRFLSTENLTGGRSLTVTIPEWHPAIVYMPGFYDTARGQTVNCAYSWTSRAVESGYTIGFNGISFQTGNGERNDGNSEPFTMRKRDTGDVDEGSTCIP
jgi:hypothetical protein